MPDAASIAVRISYFEIYKEAVFDLLVPREAMVSKESVFQCRCYAPHTPAFTEPGRPANT